MSILSRSSSRLSRRAIAGLALLLVFGLSSLAPAQLPALGDGEGMTLGAERRLGDQIARELYRDPDYLDDPVLQEYEEGIWQQLLQAARQRGDLTPDLDERFAWQVLLGKDRQAGRVLRQFDVNDVAEATALALMEDLASAPARGVPAEVPAAR